MRRGGGRLSRAFGNPVRRPGGPASCFPERAATGATLRARDEESPKPALFLLFKVGGAAPNADAVARCCRAALEGIAKAQSGAEETAALKKALEEAAASETKNKENRKPKA